VKVLVGLPLKTKEIVKVVKVLLNLKEIIFKVVSSRGVGKTFTTFTTFTFESCSKDSALATAATKFCLIPFPGDTALIQQFQFSVSRRLETSRAEPSMTGLVKTEESSGKEMRQKVPLPGREQRGLTVYPNPIFHRRQKKSFLKSKARSAKAESESVSRRL